MPWYYKELYAQAKCSVFRALILSNVPPSYPVEVLALVALIVNSTSLAVAGSSTSIGSLIGAVPRSPRGEDRLKREVQNSLASRIQGYSV